MNYDKLVLNYDIIYSYQQQKKNVKVISSSKG
jgi:hypothetical protein